MAVVLTMAVGQNALLCQAWCVSPEVAASTCHHETQSSSLSPKVASNTGCDHTALAVPVFLKEDTRRGSAPEGDPAIAPPRYQLALSAIDAGLHSEPGRPPLFEQRALVTALRI